jgi:hypothetical protein
VTNDGGLKPVLFHAGQALLFDVSYPRLGDSVNAGEFPNAPIRAALHNLLGADRPNMDNSTKLPCRGGIDVYTTTVHREETHDDNEEKEDHGEETLRSAVQSR